LDLFDSWIFILCVPAASSFGNFFNKICQKEESPFKVNVLVLTNQREEPVLGTRDR
jgi:hypothetical protein